MGADLDRAGALQLQLQLRKGALGLAPAGVSAYRHCDVGQYSLSTGLRTLDRDFTRNGDVLVLGAGVEELLQRRFDREYRGTFTFYETVQLHRRGLL